MSPETIRAHALECTYLAQNADDPERRSLLLDIAYLCADLASALDRFQAFAEAIDIPIAVKSRIRARPRLKRKPKRSRAPRAGRPAERSRRAA
jgi:hypothetical protein